MRGFDRKRPRLRLRLEPKAYRQLCRRVLKREDGAARTAEQQEIFRCTTSAREASWVTTLKETSLPFAQNVTERGIFTARRLAKRIPRADCTT